MKKYKYTYAEWSQDTKTWEIESNKQLTEEEVIGIASNSSMDEKSSYKTKDFVCNYFVIFIHCVKHNIFYCKMIWFFHFFTSPITSY